MMERGSLVVANGITLGGWVGGGVISGITDEPGL